MPAALQPVDQVELGSKLGGPWLGSGLRWDAVSTAASIAIGAVAGLALGVVVSATTDVPLAPEIGLLVGLLGAWLYRRKGP